MPTKGMRSICFNSKTASFSISRTSSPSRASVSFPTPRRTSAPSNFTDAMISEIIGNAAVLVMKWNPDDSSYAKVTSVFYENKKEAYQFIKRVNDLQKAMHFLVSEDPTSERLVHAQGLMQVAMKRLQKEFYQILSMNRAHLDPESVSARSSRASARSSTSDYEDDGGATTDDDVKFAGASIKEVEQVSSVAMADLKSIAECMISSGYAKECVHIYKIIRKSIIDEGIYRLGVERLSSSQITKMDQKVLELRLKSWLNAVKVCISTLFNGERILCDHVFAASDSIRESCFTHIAKEAATLLFSFPQVLLAKTKKLADPEIIFRLLDMYSAISENWPDIDYIFSFESTDTVRSQAIASLIRLGETVRAKLLDFESTIQKESNKSPVGGGGVHPLTIHVMNYLSLLTDYSNVLADIFIDWSPPAKLSMPDSYFDTPHPEDSPATAICLRMAWLMLIFVCKLDRKAKHYKDVSLSYLFLVNNLQHVISKVRSSNLQYLLGEEWIAKHEGKVRQFAANYERLAWEKVLASLPENPRAAISPEEARLIFRNFNFGFEETYRKQRSIVIPDAKLRDEIKASIAKKLVSVYREFYDTHRLTVGAVRNVALYVRFTPEDVGNNLSDLYFGTTDSGSSSPFSSSSSSSHRRSR